MQVVVTGEQSLVANCCSMHAPSDAQLGLRIDVYFLKVSHASSPLQSYRVSADHTCNVGQPML